jgi:hypothetical protein
MKRLDGGQQLILPTRARGYAILRIYGLYLTALKMLLRRLPSNPEARCKNCRRGEQQENKHERKREIINSNEIPTGNPEGEDS